MTGSKATILVVDDEANNRNVMVAQLASEGYELVTSASGEEALELIDRRLPDLILLDVMMPGMDGFELCRRSKAELLTCHIPFLLLTAKGDEENRAEGYSAGADGYIAKPFSIKTLRTRVNSLIEQRIKLRERYRQKLLTDPSEIQIESENDKFIDTLVNAGMEMNRRIIGFAGVAELKQIENTELRAGCERRALTMARDLIVNARQFKNMDSVIQSAKVK